MKKLSLILLLVASTAYGDVMYTWTDARGTRHYVSSQDDIPARYRSRAKVYDVATGKRLPLSAAPAATATAPAGTAAQPAAPAVVPQPQPQGAQPQAPQMQAPVPSTPAVIQQAPAPQPQPQRARRRNRVPEEE